MKEKQKTSHVFWTGGQDSTFRLLQLLLTTEDLVQAHYIVRHEGSTGNEIDTQNKIRRATIEKHPELRSRFLPTIYTNEDLIPKYTDIDQEIERIRKKVKVHEQLQILARYCRAFKIEQIDLIYERDLVVDEDKRVAHHFGVSSAFQSFTNPLVHMTKRDCYLMAKDKGWDDLLLLSSFCRRPKKKDKPCGICGPCSDVLENGMGFRLPLIARMKAGIQLPFRQYYRKNYLNQNKGVFKWIKRKFESRL